MQASARYAGRDRGDDEMSRDDIKEIIASEYTKACLAKKRGRQTVINAEKRIRKALRAMGALKMEVPEVIDK